MIKSIYYPLCLLISLQSWAQTNWKHLSTEKGSLPLPWKSTQQTSLVIIDFTNDGVSDFVIGCRQQAPALVGYSFDGKQWQRYVLENEFLTIEAGGTAFDIDADGDGDQDLVFGGDWQSNTVWWWENPYPNLAKEKSWKRHVVKNSGTNQHHDQIFGDFKQTGKAQLAFWNQGSTTLFLAEIPENVQTAGEWKREVVFSGQAGQNAPYAEGVASADIDGDGYADLLAGNYWFRYEKGKGFQPIRIGEIGGRIATGKFKAGKSLQVVIAPGDGSGPVTWYENIGEIIDPKSWKGHNLAGRDFIHGHALEVADINSDGNLDIFAAEMAKWTESKPDTDNPKAEALIFYGDGLGNFRKEVFQTGFDFHETKLADIDGDGDIDIISKPYNWKAPRLDIWLQGGTGKRVPAISTYLNGHVGLELYSLREELKKDVPSSFRKIAAMGIKEVEVPGFYGLSPAAFKAELIKAGLTPTSALFSFELFRDSLSSIIKSCKALGVTQAGTAWIPHGKTFTREDALTAIDLFNRAGASLKAAGIRFFYHPHGYEFVPSPEGTLFDLMATKMKPGLADFQLDVFWAVRGGADPTLLLKKYPGRFISLHVKDVEVGLSTGDAQGGAPEETSVIIGKGQVDFKAVFKATIQNGIKHFYIEDEHPKAIEQIPQSLAYIRSLK
ncbi:MAG: sugar phosphate isomerase/epimerase [Cyclobacteriaceae bacterium]|nr:sugar phosphate isomerase/epimerase [Cyclobacteriaceae bacterium]